jgi:hypothetical protein
MLQRLAVVIKAWVLAQKTGKVFLENFSSFLGYILRKEKTNAMVRSEDCSVRLY